MQESLQQKYKQYTYEIKKWKTAIVKTIKDTNEYKKLEQEWQKTPYKKEIEQAAIAIGAIATFGACKRFYSWGVCVISKQSTNSKYFSLNKLKLQKN